MSLKGKRLKAEETLEKKKVNLIHLSHFTQDLI